MYFGKRKHRFGQADTNCVEYFFCEKLPPTHCMWVVPYAIGTSRETRQPVHPHRLIFAIHFRYLHSIILSNYTHVCHLRVYINSGPLLAAIETSLFEWSFTHRPIAARDYMPAGLVKLCLYSTNRWLSVGPCADPESFVRGGPNLIFLVDGG